MSLISLRESLARSKAKWKKRFQMSSNNKSQAPTCDPPSSGCAYSASAPLTGSTESNPLISEPTQAGGYRTGTTPGTNTSPEENKSTWSGIKSLLAILESNAESASTERREYDELRGMLEGLLDDLAKHMANPMGFVMTNSVKRLCAGIEVELKSVEEIRVRHIGRRLIDATGASNEILEYYRRIQGYLERLTLNANMSILKTINDQATELRLARMAPSMSAVYNSAESDYIKRGGCTPGTRGPQIDLLLEWARTPDTGRTCWMNGMAGTGKTTIAYSVCDRLDQTFELGASFFCSRIIPECRQVKYIIPTVAYQLARFSLPFRCALGKVLESDPDAHTRALKIQYQKLVVDPLLEVQASLPTDFIVVIDALDECENENGLGQILDLLISSQASLPLKLLLSSRPEMEITRRMASRECEQGETQLVLHDLDSHHVKSDIETYMRHELRHIPLTDSQWFDLLNQCGVLFIYASTTCRYIEQAHNMNTLNEAVSIVARLFAVPMEHGDENAIDELYLSILAAVFQSGISQVNKRRMKNILETVICAMEPMTLDMLAEFLGLESGKQVDSLLQPLRSILNVTATTGLVTTLHASFPDFVFSSDRSKAFHCTPGLRHGTLAEACLKVIERVKPEFNICSLPSSHLSDDKVEDLDQRVSRTISPWLLHSCRYWSTHLYLGEYRGALVDQVREFFSTRLLVWMEILDLTRHMRFGTSIIREAEKWCSEQPIPDDIAKMASDALQFVSVYANHPISQSTPHIYVSMLPFWPQSRPVSNIYMPRTIGIVQPTGTAIGRRQPALLGTWNLPRWVLSMGLSADGTRLVVPTGRGIDVDNTYTGKSIFSISEERTIDVEPVSISPDGTRIAFSHPERTIYLLDTKNGGLITEPFPERIPGVRAIAFSPDGSSLALGSGNGDVYNCRLNIDQKELIPSTYNGHTAAVRSIAFSPDGLYLASGSEDNTVRVWDVTAGQITGEPFESHNSTAISLSYSPDGSRLALASLFGYVWIYDPRTGQVVLGPHCEPTITLCCVSFSPNGRHFATGGQDSSIRVHDAMSGHTIFGPLHGHTSEVNSVIFSPDSTRLYSCSWDRTVRIWDVKDPDVVDRTPSTAIILSRIESVRYSYSGQYVACGSSDGTIYVWDVQTGDRTLGPLVHPGYITSVDYSPNEAYIASVSRDTTLRIWDAWDGRNIHGPLQGHDSWLKQVRFSPDSSLVVSGCIGGTMRIWDVKSGQTVFVLKDEEEPIEALGFSPDGSRVVIGSHYDNIRVLDWRTNSTIIGPLRAYYGSVSSVEYSSDGTRILSSGNGSIKIMDAYTGQKTLAFDGTYSKNGTHSRLATLSPDGRLIASGADDGTICVWDAESGQLVLGPLKKHAKKICSIQFSPDGLHIVTCSNDGTIRFWDVSSCKANPRANKVTGEGKVGERSLNLGNPLDNWNLDDDGWVVDEKDQKLVWIPPDLRNCLLWPLNESMISGRGWLKLDFDGANIGEQWTSCYQP